MFVFFSPNQIKKLAKSFLIKFSGSISDSHVSWFWNTIINKMEWNLSAFCLLFKMLCYTFGERKTRSGSLFTYRRHFSVFSKRNKLLLNIFLWKSINRDKKFKTPVVFIPSVILFVYVHQIFTLTLTLLFLFRLLTRFMSKKPDQSQMKLIIKTFSLTLNGSDEQMSLWFSIRLRFNPIFMILL